MKANKKITITPENKGAAEFLGKMDAIKAELLKKLDAKNEAFSKRLKNMPPPNMV